MRVPDWQRGPGWQLALRPKVQAPPPGSQRQMPGQERLREQVPQPATRQALVRVQAPVLVLPPSSNRTKTRLPDPRRGQPLALTRVPGRWLTHHRPRKPLVRELPPGQQQALAQQPVPVRR